MHKQPLTAHNVYNGQSPSPQSIPRELVDAWNARGCPVHEQHQIRRRILFGISLLIQKHASNPAIYMAPWECLPTPTRRVLTQFYFEAVTYGGLTLEDITNTDISKLERWELRQRQKRRGETVQ